MEIYSSEEQQVEAIKRFWNSYGKAILGGVVIGLAGLYGWRYFQAEQRSQAEQVSTEYSQLLEQQQTEGSDWLASAKGFIDAKGDTSYAVFAALLAAREAIDSQQLAVAAEHLSWVVNNAADAPVQAIAQLRLARVQREQGNYADALATLQLPVPASFVGQQAELKGDVLQLTGELAQAKAAYQQALASSEQTRPLLQVKLDELAHITAS
ncbi:Putative negative regulator of RcsB-dependent stress response [Arsukibacterium tuosuense]|uniref:Ancillary SecYEG translocon subunit n=1 Tax=Arsukibacterium tuosuense TaxID=1323745 RepID=A0A285JEY9_9GAMM|nr:tetratricopeptide repeat protein [Arsukibacterium tuosuense]SNY57956.1 Putative negative regulator of RcsB-dependent stress response [Arsukibacterium tuosuense]